MFLVNPFIKLLCNWHAKIVSLRFMALFNPFKYFFVNRIKLDKTSNFVFLTPEEHLYVPYKKKTITLLLLSLFTLFLRIISS